MIVLFTSYIIFLILGIGLIEKRCRYQVEAPADLRGERVCQRQKEESHYQVNLIF